MIAYVFQKYPENFAFQLSSLAYFLTVSMNTKISVFVICVEAIIYNLHDLHDYIICMTVPLNIFGVKS